MHRLSYSRLMLAIWVASVIGVWLAGTPPGILGKTDAIGYAICHRIDVRSFHAHGRALPLCARCTGIYLGVIVALVVYAQRGRLYAAQIPRLRFLAMLVMFGVVYGFDGLNSYLSLFPGYHPVYTPHNTLRLLTGTTFGIALVTVVLPVFNSIVWRDLDQRAPVDRVRDLLALYAIAAGTASVVMLVEWPILRDPVRIAAGLVSVAGVLLMFAGIGVVASLVVLRRENHAILWRDLARPAWIGLAFAFSVIGAIDLLRYVFTGTWAGFDGV